MDSKTIVPLLVTAILAFVGFAVKYLNDVAIARRKDKLERVNLQLKHLYGPLYATVYVQHVAWLRFRANCRPGIHFFRGNPPPTAEDLVAWRLWISEVFMPFNLRVEKIIVDNGDLLIEEQLPDCLLGLCAHIAAYKPILKKWESGDYSSLFPLGGDRTDLLKYDPDALLDYAKNSYFALKNTQASLLGSLRVTIWENPEN